MNAYDIAKKRYAELGIDTDKVIDELRAVNVSMHCWQGDDVRGFDFDGELSGAKLLHLFSLLKFCSPMASKLQYFSILHKIVAFYAYFVQRNLLIP